MADDRNRRRPIPKAQRDRILARDGHQCQYCGTPLDDSNATIDHVVPITLTGSAGNDYPDPALVAACRSCNSRKGARLLVRLPFASPAWFTADERRAVL